MEAPTTNLKTKTIATKDNHEQFYTVAPVEIANALNTAIIILQEYSITDLNGENYKLYRTKEGNWYDISSANPCVHNLQLMSFKLAINSQEMNH